MRQQLYKCVDCGKVFKQVWANVGILDTEEGDYLKEDLGERVVGPLEK
jgi:DNA-directed RNA polymerase subunit RPC12/RpoP